MRKKIVIALSALCIVMLGVFVSVGVVKAATSVRSFTLFKSVNLLGLSLLRSDSTQFDVVDMSTSTANYVVTLPSVTGNNGMVYVVKRVGGGEYTIGVQPDSGEAIDTSETADIGLYNNGDVAMFVADDTADTWWVIGTSPGQL